MIGTAPACRVCLGPLGYDALSLRDLRCTRCRGEHRAPLILPVDETWADRVARRQRLEMLDALLWRVEEWNATEDGQPLALIAAAQALRIAVPWESTGPQLHEAICEAQAVSMLTTSDSHELHPDSVGPLHCSACLETRPSAFYPAAQVAAGSQRCRQCRSTERPRRKALTAAWG